MCEEVMKYLQVSIKIPFLLKNFTIRILLINFEFLKKKMFLSIVKKHLMLFVQ